MELRAYETRMLLREFGIPILEDHIIEDTSAPLQSVEEFFIAITTHRTLGRPLLQTLFAPQTAIAQLRENHLVPLQEPIDAIHGLKTYQVNRLASEMDIPREIWSSFVELVKSLYKCYEQTDAQHIELSPLVTTPDNSLVVLNGYALIDDNALFRQSRFVALSAPHDNTTPERMAREAGLEYVTLDGHIGCIVNEAGLGMALMDTLDEMGIGAAHLLDVESTDKPDVLAQALYISTADVNTKVICINIFGGLTRCDDVAHGLLSALAEVQPRHPIVVRLEGTNAYEGSQILESADIPQVRLARSFVEAAQLAFDLAARD